MTTVIELPTAIRLLACALLAVSSLSCRCSHDTPESRRQRALAASIVSAPVPAWARDVDRSQPGVIVVLGSSTSAGIGPRAAKNAWVARYQAYLAERFPNFELTNLAVGGQTTYHIQATGFVPPAGRPAPVADKNISAALALSPDAIIVSMPSNDAAASIPLAEQLANYDRLAALASAARVLLWVSTSQPRNFDSDAQRALLRQASTAIERNFAPRVLDFWTPFADAAGGIAPELDSGDGTHLNDAAHATLASIVIAARIPETLRVTR